VQPCVSAESEGTVTNLDGKDLELRPAGRSGGDCKSGWKIIRRLGAELGLEGFEQVSLAEVCNELGAIRAGRIQNSKPKQVQAWKPEKGFYRIGDLPLYGLDALCRRSNALQATVHAESDFAGLNPKDAKRLKLENGNKLRLTQGGAEIEMPLRVLDDVPEGGVWLRSATCATSGLGEAIGPIKVAIAEGAS